MCRCGVNETVGDALVVTQSRKCPAGQALARLLWRQNGAQHAFGAAGQRLALQFGQRGDAGNFLDQISLAQNIGPPGRRRGHVARQRESQRLQGFALVFGWNVHADKADNPGSIKSIGAGRVRCLAISNDMRRGATAQVKDHLRRQFQTGQREGGVDAAFKTIAGVRVDLQGAARGGNGNRVPISAFHEDVSGVRRAARRLTTHDAGQGFRAVVVRNQHLARKHGVGLAIQCLQGFAARCGVNAQVAVDLGDVKDVQGAVHRVSEEVCDVDKGRDRAQADGFQTVGQPCRGGAVADAFDRATGEMRASSGFQTGVDMNRNRAVELAFDGRNDQGFQRPKATGGKVTGDAAHAQGVGAVGRDLDVDHRVVQPAIVDEAFAQWRVVGQFDDAVVVVRQHQLAFRTQHPV